MFCVTLVSGKRVLTSAVFGTPSRVSVPIVGGVGDAVDAGIDDGVRHRVGRDRAARVVLRDQIVFGLVDEADARADALGDLALEIDRRVVRIRRGDVRIELNRAGQRRRGRVRRLLTELVAADRRCDRSRCR